MSAKKKPAEESQRRSRTDATSESVTVEVINQSIFEQGAVRHLGARFETTAERAECLRHFVKIVTP